MSPAGSYGPSRGPTCAGVPVREHGCTSGAGLRRSTVGAEGPEVTLDIAHGDGVGIVARAEPRASRRSDGVRAMGHRPADVYSLAKTLWVVLSGQTHPLPRNKLLIGLGAEPCVWWGSGDCSGHTAGLESVLRLN